MLSPPVTAAFVLGAVLFSVYYLFKSSSSNRQQQYEYSSNYSSPPGYNQRRRITSRPYAEDSGCAICLGTEDGVMLRTRCNHGFHRHCLTNWLNEGQPSCPLCRLPLN